MTSRLFPTLVLGAALAFAGVMLAPSDAQTGSADRRLRKPAMGDAEGGGAIFMGWAIGSWD